MSEKDGSKPRIEVYDTTLRDGSQMEHVSFSLEDKVEIARHLDEFGVDLIEGGWPGSNPKDEEFFGKAQGLELTHARIAAFGSTRRADTRPEDDANLQKLVASNTPVITVFGKAWDLHVTDALRTTLDENLAMIRDSVAFLKDSCDRVIYDAEHYFDGLAANRDYALATLKAATEAGAETVVLCDTCGGMLPEQIASGVAAAREALGDGVMLGIHCHNDSGLGVAGTLAGIEAGCTHLQGTINGFGERCGNADLLAVIANLGLKMGYDQFASGGMLKKLTETSRQVYEISNRLFDDSQPFVGRSAFAHKGGVHVSAVGRNPRSYEHVEPELVGNQRRFLVSELSGRSNLVEEIGHMYDIKSKPEDLKKILEAIQEREHQGYEYEGAGASLDLLVRKHMGDHCSFFDLHGFRAYSERRDDGTEVNEASIKLEVDGVTEHTVDEGNGPVDALNGALRKALIGFYPELDEIALVGYRVRIVNPRAASAASVLVSIRTIDHADEDLWTTVGVSENIIEASWIALVDSIEYKLLKSRARND